MNNVGHNIFFVSPSDRVLVRKIKMNYKFYYEDFEKYLEEEFLEEMKDHELN